MEENERREGVLKQHFALYAKKPSIKDCFVTVFIFMICTIIGLLFQKLHFPERKRFFLDHKIQDT